MRVGRGPQTKQAWGRGSPSGWDRDGAPRAKLSQSSREGALGPLGSADLRRGLLIAVGSPGQASRPYCPATDGFSTARIEEEVVVTEKGCKVITRFPAEELPIANAY